MSARNSQVERDEHAGLLSLSSRSDDSPKLPLMLDRVLTAYDQHAAQIAVRHSAAGDPWASLIRANFRTGESVIELGAGIGDVASQLIGIGCTVVACEPSVGMRDEAVSRHPELSVVLSDDSLPLPHGAHPGPFDGAICLAVLMHLPEEKLFDAAFGIRSRLKPGGRLLLSVSEPRAGLNDRGEDQFGRFFNACPSGQYRELFERIGFTVTVETKGESAVGENILHWCSWVMERQDARSHQPLERLEAVLNRDRKTATYKLALLRALSEIATQEHHLARWFSADEVGVPVAEVARKWMQYYWPIFDQPEGRFIPQNNGEHPDSGKPVSFRALLTQLAQLFRDQGGFAAYNDACESGRLTGEAEALHRNALRKLIEAIKTGPVVFASGKLFRCHDRGRFIVMHSSVWREFARLGQWIEPAVLLRWAEETARMSKGETPASTVLELLLRDLDAGRKVSAAADVFRRTPQLECVWTARRLDQQFDVDHGIAFSLWRNNDLWNLFPANAAANNAKSDRLPTADLLRRRRGSIIGCWELLSAAYPSRFEREASRFVGRAALPPSWQALCFSRFAEAVESTAIQRQVDRWEP